MHCKLGDGNGNLLQPLIVRQQDLEQKFPKGCGRPDPKLRRLEAIHPTAYRDDCLKVY